MPPVLYPSSSSTESSPSNFSKISGTVIMLNSASNRLIQYRKYSTPILNFDSIGVAKFNDEVNYETSPTANYKKKTFDYCHVSRRRNSSSVAPLKHVPSGMATNILSAIPNSNSVNSSLFVAGNGKRAGYSLDRNNNVIESTNKNYQRYESKIQNEDELSLPRLPYRLRASLSSSTSSVTPPKYPSSSSNSPSDSSTAISPNRIAPNDLMERNDVNEKIIRHSDCVSKLSSRLEFYRLYEIGRIIGQGNFSDVYVVYSESTSHKYAVKEINKLRMYGKLYFVENEIAILKHCNHRNICKLIDAFECQNFYFLVFEYAQKGDLFETIKRMGRLSERYAAQITHQVSSALHYLHSRKIVHRDVKPENILLGANLCAKLTDFGLACTVGGPLYRVCGTPTYVAPEILSQEGYGVEVDVWSLGILLYVMLIGFAPFRCSDRAQLFRLIVKAKVSFDMPTWSKISSKAKQLILKMLTPKVNNRLKAIEVINSDWLRLYNESPDTYGR